MLLEPQLARSSSEGRWPRRRRADSVRAFKGNGGLSFLGLNYWDSRPSLSPVTSALWSLYIWLTIEAFNFVKYGSER